MALITEPSSRAEVEGKVELYICSPSGPSWSVLGRTSLNVVAIAKLLVSPNKEHKLLHYVHIYLPNYTAAHSEMQYPSVRHAVHSPMFEIRQMLHVACKGEAADGYILFSKLQRKRTLVEKSVDGRIIFIGLNEFGGGGCWQH